MIHKRCRTGACMACRFDRDDSGQLELIPGRTGWQYPAQHALVWPRHLVPVAPSLGPNQTGTRCPPTAPEATLFGSQIDSKPTAGRGRYPDPKEIFDHGTARP